MGNRNGWPLQIALSGLLCEVGTDVLCVGVFPLRHLVPRRTDIYAFESKPDPVFVAQKFSIRHWSPQTEAAFPVVADPARSAHPRIDPTPTAGSLSPSPPARNRSEEHTSEL